jgi:hypothetical protein
MGSKDMKSDRLNLCAAFGGVGKLALSAAVLFFASSAHAQTQLLCTTKISAVIVSNVQMVVAYTGLGVVTFCNTSGTLTVDNNGNNTLTQQDCQYISANLINAKNSQSDVEFILQPTPGHPVPSACTNSMYNWNVPDPYPAAIVFY